MKETTPGNLAFWAALGFTAVFVVLVVTMHLPWFPDRWYVYLIIGVILFVITHQILTRTFRTFFYMKIRPLYRIINRTKHPEKALQTKLKHQNPLESVYQEVSEWAQNKTSEIDQLKANEQFRKEFIGNVSHELKTPIFNIQGYILTLLEGGLEDPEINRAYLERAEKSINRMIQVVKDLEYIARIESGELELIREKFDMIKLVEEVFELHEMRAGQRHIELKFARRPERPVFVNADRKRIFEVMGNLVVNAIAYGNQGGYVKVDFLDMDHNVLIEVSDNGLGIKEEEQSRIFERFYRVDKSRSREQGGTGLGLAIVKHFIEAHGHEINLRSKSGEGSSFTFTLDKAK